MSWPELGSLNGSFLDICCCVNELEKACLLPSIKDIPNGKKLNASQVQKAGHLESLQTTLPVFKPLARAQLLTGTMLICAT